MLLIFNEVYSFLVDFVLLHFDFLVDYFLVDGGEVACQVMLDDD